MTLPLQSYSILYSAFLAPTADTIPLGYGVTRVTGGYAVASTANLAVSLSGGVDGVALELGNPGKSIQVQKDAEVPPGLIPWLGTGIRESAVIDANGKVQRASVATGTVIGTVTKDGGVVFPGGSSGIGTLAGDVTGASSANTVVKIQGRSVTTGVPSSGDALVWNGSAWAPAAVSGTLAGDVTGAIGANTVGKLQNRDVSSGAPTTGNQLAWNGSAWAPAALNLAGGSAYVTGVLPAANQASQTLAGDATGTTAASVVEALTGNGGEVLVRGTAAIGFGTGRAASGDVRVRNNTTAVAARNQAGSGDIPLIGTNNFNHVNVGGSAAALVTVEGSAQVQLAAGAAARLVAGTSSVLLNDGVLVFTAGTVATSGDIRLPYNGGSNHVHMSMYRSGLSTSQPIIGTNTDTLTFGSSSYADAQLKGIKSTLLTAGGASLVLDGSAATFTLDNASTAIFNAALIQLRNNIKWEKATSLPEIFHEPQTTNVATSDLTITAQDAYTSATGTNRNGANMRLYSGSNASGGVEGRVFLNDVIGVRSSEITIDISTFSSALAGAAVLPANPVGFLPVTINGTARLIPYYSPTS